MPKIEVNGVTKTFDEGKVLAIDDISFKIEDGSFIFLLGPSGCGKTTLLKLIPHTKGTIKVDGEDFASINPEDRSIWFVFQHFEIFPNMTVYENVAYGLQVRGYSDRAIENVVIEALQLVKLEQKALKTPDTLSTP